MRSVAASRPEITFPVSIIEPRFTRRASAGSPLHAWAVGDTTKGKTLILHWNGSKWH
jgi:hypothetical protein